VQDVFERVLLCYDGSPAGRRALKRGAELALLVKAEVHVLSIIPELARDAVVAAVSAGTVCLLDYEAEYSRSLEDSVALLKARGLKVQGTLTRGNTLDEIAVYAKRLSVDLIVVGHYPKAPGGRWWSGPERASLAERVNCCVFIAVNDPDDASAA